MMAYEECWEDEMTDREFFQCLDPQDKQGSEKYILILDNDSEES
jgi:hypothetical protein